MNLQAGGEWNFIYEIDANRVVDGDTFEGVQQFGCGQYADKIVRLHRIDAWEKRGSEKEKGLIAKQWLADQIEGKRVVIKTQKDKKGMYGRLIADVYLDGVCLNDRLVELGHAVYKEY